MKRFFKIYFSYLLRIVVTALIVVIINYLLKGFPSKNSLDIKSLDIGSLTSIIGLQLIGAAIMTFFTLVPDFIRKMNEKMNEKTQRDIDEYKRLKHISQEQKINKH